MNPTCWIVWDKHGDARVAETMARAAFIKASEDFDGHGPCLIQKVTRPGGYEGTATYLECAKCHGDSTPTDASGLCEECR